MLSRGKSRGEKWSFGERLLSMFIFESVYTARCFLGAGLDIANWKRPLMQSIFS